LGWPKNGIMIITSFVKICQLIYKLKGETSWHDAWKPE
jgi:hypothetical protein